MRAACITGLSLLLVAPAFAQDSIVGTYDLEGREKGSAYSGQARIDRDGDELVLTTDLEGDRSRRQARAALEPNGEVWTFRFPSAGSDASAGMGGRLEGAGGRTRGKTPERVLEVRRRGDILCVRLRENGKTLAYERLEASTPAGLSVTALAPRDPRFLPHHPTTGRSSIRVRYRLQPLNTPLAVRVEVRDRDGQLVHLEEQGEARDTGQGLIFDWDGYLGSNGYADARQAPYRISIAASQGTESATSTPVDVIPVPMIDKAWVISRVGTGSWTAANKVVDHGADLEVTVVVRAIVGGDRAAGSGRTDRVHYVLDGVGATSVRLDGRTRQLETWSSQWPALNVAWQKVMPLGLHSPVYRPTQNERRATRDGEFTNVVANGDREGTWIGLDVIEYEHVSAGSGKNPRGFSDPGTYRFRCDVNYRSRALELDEADAPGTPGKRSGSTTTVTRVFSGLLAGDFDRQLAGAHDKIHRISRKGNNPVPILAAIEVYRKVPWIYGSMPKQVESFIGYDCADMVLGAARIAGVTTRQFTNAHNMCEIYTNSMGHPTLKWTNDNRLLNLEGEEQIVRFGRGPNAVMPGDIIFFDWDGDGRWNHTTLVVSGGGYLDMATQLIWAHHDSGSVDGYHQASMRDVLPRDRTNVRMAIRRF